MIRKEAFIVAVFLCSTVYLTGITYAAGNKNVKNIKIPEPGTIQIITTVDGSTNIGKITEIRPTEIVVETGYGTLVIPIDKIERIKEVPENPLHNTQYWFLNPNRTRLFFAPTGRMLKKGDGYFGVYEVFFPTVNYGVTDNMSLGGGISIFPTGRFSQQIYYFTPKISLKQSEKINIAAGVLMIKLPDADDEKLPLVSVLYGVGTYGTHNRSMTLALGYGMENNKLASKPMVVLGGEQRLSRRLSLVTENWIVPRVSEVMVSLGVRFFGEASSVDLALINTVGDESLFPGIPYVDFVYNF